MYRGFVYLLLTYLLTAWSRVLLEKLTGSQPVKKFPAFYGTRKFITAFTRARHLSISSATSSPCPQPTFCKLILVLSSHLHLGHPCCLFPSGFSPKPCIHLFSPPHVLHAPLISLFSNNIWWAVPITKLLIIQFSPLPCYLVLLRPKYSSQHPILKHPHLLECERPRVYFLAHFTPSLLHILYIAMLRDDRETWNKKEESLTHSFLGNIRKSKQNVCHDSQLQHRDSNQ